MEKYSNHKIVYELLQACIAHGVKHIVISPGSRNAPLTLSFAKHSETKCYSIVDERTAAFFALGLAQQLKSPVALLCTSGTAVLNYAPAVAEAYYQNIPLIVISADRPKELIDQAEGQSIRQENVLQNIVERSYQLPSGNANAEIAYARRLCGEALAICLHRQRPVHINIPLWEPLYGTKNYEGEMCMPIRSSVARRCLEEADLERVMKVFNRSEKVLILAGFMSENTKLNALLEELADNKKCVVLTETIANLKGKSFHYNIDRLLCAMENKTDFVPDLLITFGGTLVSKMVKQWLREHKPKEHWHLNDRDYFIDTFQCLTENMNMTEEAFFSQLMPRLEKKTLAYSNLWNGLEKSALEKHQSFVERVSWSDFVAFEKVLNYLPKGSLLHLGNSTVIRYHQLFPYNSELSYACNRGTSGIDGCTSTAVGAAFMHDGFTTLITGDISLGYDSNALWHQYVSPKLRIVVINNGGGGIFRFLEGSSKQKELEAFFETTHSAQSYEHLAAHWGISYNLVANKEDLEKELASFYSGNEPKLVEIRTPELENAKVLRAYFEYLKEK